MKRIAAVLLVIALSVPDDVTAVELPDRYQDALELIHSYDGGDELNRAMAVARELAVSHPQSGYAQVLMAEMISTWQMRENERSLDAFTQVMMLTSESIRLNPNLAQSYVARARAELRTSQYYAANKSIDLALAREPTLSGALFLRGDVYRRQGDVENAEIWYGRFIDSTPSAARKSNGYFWMATMYSDAAEKNASERGLLVEKARAAYQKSAELKSGAAWPNVNLAIFLNDMGEDYIAAERYAQRALGVAEFPMARYHLAIARYQQLLAVEDNALVAKIEEVQSSTNVSLRDALSFAKSAPRIHARLSEIQGRASARVLSH